MSEEHRYMQAALEQAKLAYAQGEVPVGAVVVCDGVIVGFGYNRRETDKNVLRHAELSAIDMACRTLGGCATGDAKITGAYGLPARYVIHTVGPVWQGGGAGERALLASCYRTCLQLALEHGCRSVAFPLISAGAFGYPKEEAMQVAVETIGGFLLQQELDVTLVIFDSAALQAGSARFPQIQS